MDSRVHKLFNAADRSYLAILKKEIHGMATAAGLTEHRTAEVDIVVAELASNLIKHAGGGEILVRTIDGNNPGIELISIDNGPGMIDPQRMIDDGISTTNTMGHGLGSIKRLSDNFQIYSLKGWGTIVLSRLYNTSLPSFSRKPQADVKAIILAKPGETLSGDGAYYDLNKKRLTIMLGDGLGHGKDANEAVEQAIAAFKECKEDDLIETFRFIHRQVRKTRGLVASIAKFDFSEKRWQILGIGNIATRMQRSLGSKSYIAYNGIVGMNIPNTMKVHDIDSELGQVLVMCSDGIKSSIDFHKYTGIFKCDLSIVAAAVYKDFARRTDDMSVVVSRINAAYE